MMVFIESFKENRTLAICGIQVLFVCDPVLWAAVVF
jgi:hypothetical protein